MKATTAAHRARILRKLLSLSTLRKLALLLLVWTIIEAHVIYYRIARAERESRARAVLYSPERVYIASLHWNNERILRSDWNKAVLELVNALGPENVFVSVYESGSWDKSKDALRELERDLEKAGVGKKIVLEDTTHADLVAAPPEEKGWMAVSPDGKKAPRRIPYLSKLRNLSLQPLRELAENGTAFDHVLFLGDVVFTVRVSMPSISTRHHQPAAASLPQRAVTNAPSLQVRDVIALLKTNNGRYAAACSLDFSKPPLFYDTFALRDAGGHEHASQTWPYFRSSKSRNALTRGEPVPVSSCWNGIGLSLFPLSHPRMSTSQSCHILNHILVFTSSLHAHLSLHRHPGSQIPRHPRQPRGLAPRGVRVLPHPRRQPGLAHQRRVP